MARAPRPLPEASGLAGGLPEGQMGNPEVGHLNLGAGRVVMQDLVRIGAGIRDGSFHEIAAFRDACARVRSSGGTLHLLGLVGDGGVHAHDDHLVALVDLATRACGRVVPRARGTHGAAAVRQRPVPWPLAGFSGPGCPRSSAPCSTSYSHAPRRGTSAADRH